MHQRRSTQKSHTTNWSRSVPETTGFHDCAVVQPVATPIVRACCRGKTSDEREPVFHGSVDVRGFVAKKSASHCPARASRSRILLHDALSVREHHSLRNVTQPRSALTVVEISSGTTVDSHALFFGLHPFIAFSAIEDVEPDSLRSLGGCSALTLDSAGRDGGSFPAPSRELDAPVPSMTSRSRRCQGPRF